MRETIERLSTLNDPSRFRAAVVAALLDDDAPLTDDELALLQARRAALRQGVRLYDPDKAARIARIHARILQMTALQRQLDRTTAPAERAVILTNMVALFANNNTH